MKFCMYCGQQLVDRAAFCVKCGKPVALNPDNQPLQDVSHQNTTYVPTEVPNPIVNPTPEAQGHVNPATLTASANPAPSATPVIATTPEIPTLKQEEEVPQSPYSWAAQKKAASQPKTNTSASSGGYKNKGMGLPPLSPEREEKRRIYNQLVNQIAWRFRINGIIWCAIASIQLFIGFCIGWVGCVAEVISFNYAAVTIIAMGIINLGEGIGDISYGSEIRKSPRGVIDKVRPLGGAIAMLISNVALGGIIGVGGSLFYLIGVRDFVLMRQVEIEKEY